MAKPSAASRTLDLFGTPIAPSFGGRGIVEFEPRPESNELPLFGHNLVRQGLTTLPVAQQLKKTKVRKQPKKKRFGTARVNRRVAKTLAKKLAEAKAELAQCQARSTRRSSTTQKRSSTPKKAGPTRKQLVARIVSLQEQLDACEGRSSSANRTSIADAMGDLPEAHRISYEADYDDPVEYLSSDEERATGLKSVEAAKKKQFEKMVVGSGNYHQKLAEDAAEQEAPLTDAGDDEGDVPKRVAELLAEAKEAERQATELATLIVRGPGETTFLQKKKTALDEKAIALRTKAVRLQNYERRQAARAGHLRTKAEEMRAEAVALEKKNKRLGDVMAGTPILVGHHSEHRHRRDLERIGDRTRKSIQLTNQAKKYEQRADNAEAGTAIRSDDPDAIAKLETKLAALEKEFHGLTGFRRTNARQELTRIRARIEDLKRNEQKAGKTAQIGDVRIEWNAEVNRVQIHFPDKPTESMREKLKSHGFKWAPSQNAWQRQANDNAWFWATNIVRDFVKETKQ